MLWWSIYSLGSVPVHTTLRKAACSGVLLVAKANVESGNECENTLHWRSVLLLLCLKAQFAFEV